MKVPVSAARKLADEYKLRQVIVLGWDGDTTYITTYGKTHDDCAHAAAGANYLKQKWGWPECNDQPSRVRILERDIVAMGQQIQALQKVIADQKERLAYNKLIITT